MIRFVCKLCNEDMLEPRCKDHLKKHHQIFKFRKGWNTAYFNWIDK